MRSADYHLNEERNLPMTAYTARTKAELQTEANAVRAKYEELKGRGLKLDMSRGKPGKAQLDLVMDMFDVLKTPEDYLDGKMDVRNYGELSGVPSAKALFADLLGCRPEEIFMGGNASLNLMYDVISKAHTHGLLHSEKPWSKLSGVKFLCPAPGYDRHFAVTQSFGVEMITIAMTPEGPDMGAVEAAIQDPMVKGMWCVPKYSNPDGIVYSQATLSRIARMKPAAKDFVLMWDNAYCVHEFFGDYVPFPDIIGMCREAGSPDMVYEFASTSKVTLPGAGVSALASSEANIAYMTKLLSVEIISYDKVNQLRHARYLKDKAHTLALMKKHAAILGPKFQTVLDALDKEIAPLNIATWQRPKGGYFVSVNAMPGIAKRTIALCKEAGVVMTGAGATFPYGKDPEDSNIRIAPSLPPIAELEAALEVICACLKLAALEKLLAA